jgi:hypothetical protein
MMASQYVKRMKTVELLERPAKLFEVAIAPDESRKAQLDFIPQKRKRPVASRASSMKLIAEHAGTVAPVLHELHGQRYDAYSHWGLNE